MGNTRPRVPDYSPDLFVNREEAIHLVLNKVQGVLRSQPGYPERKRIIVFWGYRGAGKTWLLRRLAETELPRNPDTCSVYINLERFAGKSRESAIQEIMGHIGAAINLYQDWVTRYPDEKERWNKEIVYHKSRLETCGCHKDSESGE